MIQSSQIREHMEVVGSDGHHVGKVDHIKDNQLELAKFDLGAGLKHHLVPLAWIDDIDGDKVRLTITGDEAKASWRKEH